ncbi:ABC transporter substrate-binding protein [Francisella sp. 19X1-34]|uniref:ABC transporter substrate-binding protein n=1 Tax=Francisella sp. 19X1-34 TaxID=3087177 RepID=UPI002E33218F|nr:ABC transporter substrate-binding protein [Francisella sp. 19X1-34]MED7789132.1 ABC transporter substrate-binding protein [Francisella sp. 19X1-34]
MPRINKLNTFILLIMLCAFSNSFAKSIITIGPTASSITSTFDNKDIIGSDLESVKKISKHGNTHVKNIGYMRALTIESIVALKPDIVIVDPSASPASVINRLNNFGIKTIRLRKANNLNDVKENILTIANITDSKKAANKLIEKLDNQENKTQEIINQYYKQKPNKTKPKVLLLLQISGNGAYLLGKNTIGDTWLKSVGADNILGFTGMRPVSKEGLLSLKPSVVIVAQANKKAAVPYKQQLDFLHNQNGTKIAKLNAIRLDNFGSTFGSTKLQLAQKIYL